MYYKFYELITEICDENNLKHELLSNDWILKISKDNINRYLIGMSFSLNTNAVATILKDKYATYAVLSNLGIPTVKYNMVFNPKTRKNFVSDLKNYKEIKKYYNVQDNKTLIVKSNRGSCGTEVFKCDSFKKVRKVMKKLFKYRDSISICPFYDIDIEYRMIYLNGECKLIFGKKAADDNWKNNLAEGAQVIDKIDEDLVEKLKQIGEKAINATGAKFVSVDIIKTIDNKLYVMEINSNVCMLKYASFSNDKREKVKEIYKEAIMHMFEE